MDCYLKRKLESVDSACLPPLTTCSDVFTSDVCASTPSFECQLWLGGIPQAFATAKQLYPSLAAACTQEGIPAPSIQLLQKKGYKKQSELFAYAFVAFPSAECAARALAVLDGLKLSLGFIISVRLRTNNGSSKQQVSKPYEPPKAQEQDQLQAGQDPSLERQLTPLFKLPKSFRRDYTLKVGLSLEQEEMCTEKAMQRLVQHLEHNPRSIRRANGRSVPLALCDPLLATLNEFKWPEQNERSKVTSEKYIVLNRSKEQKSKEACSRGNLFDLCHSLLATMLSASADENFVRHYTHIAVTKNFCGSPHIDHSDSTFQFAMSLGNFIHGGELCVDDECGSLWVVNTHNRLAKFDGRYTHWVRGKGGGDRYSVVYFSHNPLQATLRTNGLFEEWSEPA